MLQAPLPTILRHLRQWAGAEPLKDLTDVQLLQHFLGRRDQAAFAVLVQRHGRLVWGVCRHVLRHEHDAEDAFQATFLALARQAASLRHRETVAGWLYRVAHRTATRARLRQSKRHAHEKQVPAPPEGQPFAELAWRELQRVLGEELDRLPEKYRAPFLLCCLEGRSKAEAARQLGWNEGTVSSRLARARQRLRLRLARRGMALPAVLAAGTLSLQTAAPAAVLRSTVRAAGRLSADPRVAGLIPAPVAALMEGVPSTMSRKIVALLVLTLSLLALGNGLLRQQPAAAQTTDRAPAQAPKAPPARETPPARENSVKPAVVRGRVLDPAGKPFLGARVYLVYQTLINRSREVQAASAQDGRFRLTVPAPGRDDPWEGMFVLAVAKGYGPGVEWARNPVEAGKLTLRLVKDDVPLTGRVHDLQGLPVAGVTVRVDSLSVAAREDLTAWLKALRANPNDAAAVDGQFLSEVAHPLLGKIFPPATTDKDGRFRLRGFGLERVVGLTILGPTVEYREVKAMTRPGPARALPSSRSYLGGSVAYYGARFLHAAAPSRPIVGVVRDKDTGKLLAGVTVQSHRLAGSQVGGLALVRTTTDSRGRYRLLGMPMGAGNQVKAVPGTGQPYLMAVKDVGKGRGLGPATVHFDLKRGVWIKGRVTDKATGKPWKAQVEYFAFADNPYLREAPGFATDYYLVTDADGSFRLVGLPGRGLVAARAWGDRWLMAAGADRIKGRDERGFFPTAPSLCQARGYHTLVEVNPARGADSVTCAVRLDPGRTVQGTVRGPDGKPLAGALAQGLIAYGGFGQWDNYPLKTAAFTVFGLEPGGQREVLFLHDEKRLAGAVVVQGDQKGPCVVRLQPWGTVRGRLVGKDGRPRAGVDLQLKGEPLPGSRGRFQTGTDGRFHFAGLVPGRPYYLLEMKDRYVPRGQVGAAVNVKAGQTRDLGDVRVQ
jgi:RNA polymerase sigma factor (sigma-70 family)